MSFLFRQLPNADAILAKETPSLLILVGLMIDVYFK